MEKTNEIMEINRDWTWMAPSEWRRLEECYERRIPLADRLRYLENTIAGLTSNSDKGQI